MIINRANSTIPARCMLKWYLQVGGPEAQNLLRVHEKMVPRGGPEAQNLYQVYDKMVPLVGGPEAQNLLRVHEKMVPLGPNS